MDAYTFFINDYYETFRWITKFSLENPDFKIAVKHHSSNRIDEKEIKILKDSNVETINQNFDSYEIAFQSKCVVTFCSTMGYELIGHGIPTLFLDPGRRNSAYLPDNLLYNCRVNNYEDFNNEVMRILVGKISANTKIKAEDFCLNSLHVSERIHLWFSSNNIGKREDNR